MMKHTLSQAAAGLTELTSGRWFRALTIIVAVIYLVGVSAYLIVNGAWPTPDFLIPPLVIIALVCGRGWSFVIDWLPFLMLILVYEGFRGIADDLNTRVHIQELIDAERWLTGGIPTVGMQQRFFDPANIAWYDWAATILHAAHFAAPVAFGFALWLHSRNLYWRYAVAVVALFFAGFITAYAYPAAPPWMAGELGLIPPVERIIVPTISQVSAGGGFTLAYEGFSPNPVAAIPSLHAATPALLAFILLSLRGRKAIPFLLYPAVASLAWVYIGEHYVIDVVAGWIYAFVVYAVFWDLLPRLNMRAGALLDGLHLRRRVALSGPLPSWPLALAVIGVGAYIWYNPLVSAPLQTITPPPGDEPVYAAGPSLVDFDPVDCSSGTSSTHQPDETISSFSGRYAGFIQGIDSGYCLIFTSARDFEPLSARQLGFLSRNLTHGILNPVDLRDGGRAYVVLGAPSDGLVELRGAAPDEAYAFVMRVDPQEDEGSLQDFLNQISSLILKMDAGK